jgi:ribosomal protein S27E
MTNNVRLYLVRCPNCKKEQQIFSFRLQKRYCSDCKAEIKKKDILQRVRAGSR